MNKQASLAVAALALAMSTLAIYRSNRTPLETVDESAARQLDAFDARLSKLEGDVRAQLERLDDAAGSVSVDTSKPSDAASRSVDLRPDLAKIAARLTKLEAAQKLRDAQSRKTTEPRSLKGLPRRQREQWTEAEARTHAINTALGEAERLRALRQLRGIPGGRDKAVVASMIRLAQLSKDGDTRADVWRQLSRANDDQLIPALLHAVQFDEHSEAREEAAETLGDYRSNPTVRSTLERIARQDKDDGVRRQARESLQERRRR